MRRWSLCIASYLFLIWQFSRIQWMPKSVAYLVFFNEIMALVHCDRWGSAASQWSLRMCFPNLIHAYYLSARPSVVYPADVIGQIALPRIITRLMIQMNSKTILISLCFLKDCAKTGGPNKKICSTVLFFCTCCPLRPWEQDPLFIPTHNQWICLTINFEVDVSQLLSAAQGWIVGQQLWHQVCLHRWFYNTHVTGTSKSWARA